MSDLYVCKKYETPYEEGYRVVRTIEEHDTEIRTKTIDECFKAMRKKTDEVFQRQTEERHEKGLSAYQQSFDCFSMGTIEFEIFSEVEKQLKGEEE